MAIYKVKPSPVLTGAAADLFMKQSAENKNKKLPEALRKRMEEVYSAVKKNSGR